MNGQQKLSGRRGGAVRCAQVVDGECPEAVEEDAVPSWDHLAALKM